MKTTGLAGKRVLITGAAGAIGLATARHFIRSGARVVGLDAAPQTVSTEPPEFECLTGDVTDAASLRAAIARLDELGGVDVCVANAGILAVEPWTESTAESWRRVMDVNALGVLLTFQAAAESMIRSGRGGRLLATASAAGIRPDQYSTAYCASKAAVISIMHSSALALAPHHITVNAVAPGEIDTDMHRSGLERFAALMGSTTRTLRSEMVGALPLARMGTADDVAACFAWLASDNSGYITGHTLTVDGGRLLP